MYSGARKLHLIEEVLKISNESTLLAVEDLIKKSKRNNPAKKGDVFAEFSGIWSNEEADEIERAIKEGCEQINPDDWK